MTRPSPPLGPDEVRRLERLRRLTRLLDSAVGVPGTRFRVGLDPIIGLVPGVGDAIGAAFAGWIMLEAARLGAPRSVLLRMLANIAIDTVVGAIPGLGDLFDFVWKADARNVALLERHLAQPVPTRRASRTALVAMGAAMLILAAGAIGLVIVAAQQIAVLF